MHRNKEAHIDGKAGRWMMQGTRKSALQQNQEHIRTHDRKPMRFIIYVSHYEVFIERLNMQMETEPTNRKTARTERERERVCACVFRVA